MELLLLAAGAHADDLRALAGERGIPVREVPRAEIDRLAHGRTHGGVVVRCAPRRPDPPHLVEEILRARSAPLFLVLEGMDDARNLAFTLRTAEAMGVDAVLVKRHLWDFDGAEVARSSSGAFDRLVVVQCDGELLSRLSGRVRMVACVPSARVAIFDTDLRGPLALVIGGEKRGVSAATRRLCHAFTRIPMAVGAGSLSAGHAAAIALGEAARQRGVGRNPVC